MLIWFMVILRLITIKCIDNLRLGFVLFRVAYCISRYLLWLIAVVINTSSLLTLTYLLL